MNNPAYWRDVCVLSYSDSFFRFIKQNDVTIGYMIETIIFTDSQKNISSMYMIKRILLFMAVTGLLFLGVSCAQEQEKQCREITDAISNQDFDKVTNLCDKLYKKLPDCSVKTLGDLTLSYITLAFVGATTGNQTATEQSMRRAVDCYDAAMKKDPVEAGALWEKMSAESGSLGQPINPSNIVETFRQTLGEFDAQQAAMNAESAGADVAPADSFVR